MSNELPAFMEGRPTAGYLTHAVRSAGTFIHWPSANLAITYRRSLCGVGRSGLRLRLDKDANPKPWVGIDGCDRCHARYRQIVEAAA